MTLHFRHQRGRSFAPLQKSNRNHASYVWTEALSSMVFDSAQKQSYIGWTQPKSNVDRSSSQLISGCSLWVIRVYLVLALVKFSRQGRSPFKVINVWHQLSPKRKAKLVFFLSPLRAEQQKLQERLAVLERLALEHADSQTKSRSTKGDLPKGEHI